MTIEGCLDFSRKGRAALTACTRVHHVDVEGLAPRFLDILRGERGDVGDQNVDSAERRRAVGDEFLKRGLVGHIELGAEGVHAFGLQVLDRGLHLVRVAGADRDACAFLGENIRSRAPDAFGAAGHDRAQALQSEIHVPLP